MMQMKVNQFATQHFCFYLLFAEAPWSEMQNHLFTSPFGGKVAILVSQKSQFYTQYKTTHTCIFQLIYLTEYFISAQISIYF